MEEYLDYDFVWKEFSIDWEFYKKLNQTKYVSFPEFLVQSEKYLVRTSSSYLGGTFRYYFGKKVLSSFRLYYEPENLRDSIMRYFRTQEVEIDILKRISLCYKLFTDDHIDLLFTFG